MLSFWRFVFATATLALVAHTTAQKSKNGNDERPYEFGFKIPGEQHRQESKDTEGIIMGEFGFITGDGIYHVTVFATDKDGNYRILSMKNIRVGPSPWGKKAETTTTTTTTTTPPPPPPPPSFVLQGKPGCSGCLIPTPPPPGSPPARPLVVPNLGVTYPRPQTTGNNRNPPTGQAIPGAPGSNAPGGQAPGGRPGSGPEGVYPQRPSPVVGGRPPQQRPGSGLSPPQQLPGNGLTPPQRRPGTDGVLPDGVTVDDVMGLLYKFNYTVGFHGHHETGYRNGNKEGEYYTNFRDGSARKVTYVADKDGFRPMVTIVKLSDAETPRAESEKEFGLKGYEFKWFNRR